MLSSLNMLSTQVNKDQNGYINSDNHGKNENQEENIDLKCCQMEISDVINGNSDENINLSNIKVTVGIDEDLQMILEMDPSIVDLGVDVIGCTPATISPSHTPKSFGLPPILGGYVFQDIQV